jgi:hypothetical protein
MSLTPIPNGLGLAIVISVRKKEPKAPATEPAAGMTPTWRNALVCAAAFNLKPVRAMVLLALSAPPLKSAVVS